MRENRKKAERLRREFLPEALELIEKPASPLGHLGILLICLVVLVMILWAVFGKIDVTVTARGKLSAGGGEGIRTVQAENGGRIQSIKVKEGQKVAQGDILLELVSDTARDLEELNSETQAESMYKEELIRKMQRGKTLGEKDRKESGENTDENYEQIFDYMVSVQEQNEKKIAGLKLELESAKEELKGIAQEIEILEQEEQDYRELFKGGAIPKSTWEEKKNTMHLRKQDEAVAKRKERTIESSISTAQSEYESELSAMLLECHRETKESGVNKNKSETDLESCILRAPVSGTIKSVLVNTEGGVLTPAENVVEIVPDEELVMELTVQNQDIGSIKEGQNVSIKLDAYDYQQYGKIQGNVVYVSPDSFTNENLGEVYAVKVSLQEGEWKKQYHDVEWHAGIQGTAEIKTGERRIINFFIEPLKEELDGSLNIS